ncbi:MAG TPA: zinc-binding dehydrogenase [Phycisphaerales bacterium]|nr:zinc-binding dehydrogenase [Phycisphaerales bacterium]
MRALVIQRAGSPVGANVRVVADWPEPGAPGPGQVLVRTLASALNHLDLWVGMGVPGLELAYPRVSGSDACGVVEAVGAGVDESWVGTRVVLNAAINVDPGPRPEDPPPSTIAPQYELIGEHHHGTHAERFLAPVGNVVAVNGEDHVQAGAFGLTFLTAYSMLVTKARLRPGQSVLITGIGGGVALASLALARHLGCPVVVTSRQQSKLDRARALGAEHVVLDRGQDWSREVRDWTGKRGVDLAVDSSGKATHIKSVKSLARGGAYVTCGCTSGPDAVTDLARVFWNQLRLLGSTMGTNEEFAEVTALFRAGVLRPVVDGVYTPERGGEAYARLESAEQFGKVVIDWSAPAGAGASPARG